MNVTDDHVSAAVLLTGFTPEYIGDVLGKRELSNAEFFDELEKRGYDLAEFFVSGDEFNIRWKQREQECMRYQNELLATAL